jgi:F-type H+-transporting ATPase subunit b
MPRRLILALAVGLAVTTLQVALAARAARAQEHHAAPAGAAAEKGAAAAEGHGPGGEHASDEHGDPNILEPQPTLAIWTVVVFIGLLLVLGRFAWGPLLAALHRREEHLEHVLHDTERARNEAEHLLAEHRRLMAEAQEQVRKMLEEARREAQASADEIGRTAQAEAEATRHRAERDIATARDQALLQLWSKSADLAVSVAGKVLARDLGPDEHRRLIETAMNELPAAPAAANGRGQGGVTA